MKIHSLLTVLLLFVFFSASAQNLTIYIHADTSIHASLTGRLYVFTQADTSKDVQESDALINPAPTFYKDVKGWTNSTVQSLDASSPGYPVKLNGLKPGYYKFEVLLDVNNEERALFAPGNYYSQDVLGKVDEDGKTEVHLYLKGKLQEKPFRDNDSIKGVNFKSALLSKFRHEDIFMKAAVVLPAGYAKETSKEYPVVFIIPGWGGTHYDAAGPYTAQRYGFGMGKEKIYVYLNPETQTPYGLHAFVDSRVNGPWGRALVEELVPYLEQNFRVRKDASQHFVMGQSTGGYGSLWLQVNYPTAFGGCWATSPDPVDFSDFISVNIYAPGANFFYNEQGQTRPFFFWQGKYQSTIKAYCQFENFIGDGGQMQSFDAEFGKPGKNGRPVPLFDPNTGLVDPKVAETWKPYDMALYLQQNWKTLEKDLNGKIHVFAGEDDNFYLNRAVAKLKDKMQQINAGVIVEVIPGVNHFSIWNPAFTSRVQHDIDQLIKE